MDNTNKTKGTVKWFNGTKGYGFIQPDTGGKDVFVHSSALNGQTLKDGEKVKFNLSEDRGKVSAVDVERI